MAKVRAALASVNPAGLLAGVTRALMDRAVSSLTAFNRAERAAAKAIRGGREATITATASQTLVAACILRRFMHGLSQKDGRFQSAASRKSTCGQRFDRLPENGLPLRRADPLRGDLGQG